MNITTAIGNLCEALYSVNPDFSIEIRLDAKSLFIIDKTEIHYKVGILHHDVDCMQYFTHGKFIQIKELKP